MSDELSKDAAVREVSEASVAANDHDATDPAPEIYSTKVAQVTTLVAANDNEGDDDPRHGGAGALRPDPLTRDFGEPTPVPAQALPRLLRNAALAIQRLTQAPPAIAVQSVLSVAALDVQRLFSVATPFGETVVPALFLITIATTGERKSACDKKALRAIRELAASARREYADQLRLWRSRQAAWEKRFDELAARQADGEDVDEELATLGTQPMKPISPKPFFADATYEGILKFLREKGPSAGLFSEEGGVFLAGYSMSADNRKRTAAGLSLLWDGSVIETVRAVADESDLHGRRMSMHLLVQLSVASAFLSDPMLADQGLLSRILIAAPESLAGTRYFKKPDPTDWALLREFEDRCREIARIPSRFSDASDWVLDPKEVALSQEAEDVWIHFHDEVESKLGAGGEWQSIRGLAGKLPEHATRLAGVMALFEDPDKRVLTKADMEAGITMANFYAAEALRLFGAQQVDGDIRLAIDLERWLLEHDLRLVSLPDIYQRGPNAIRDKKTAARIVEVLVNHGRLRRAKPGTVVNGRKRQDVWEVDHTPVA